MVHFLYFIVSEDAFTVGVKEGLHEISETVICIVCFHYLLMSTIKPYQDRHFTLFSHYFVILLEYLILTISKILDKNHTTKCIRNTDRFT